MLAPGGTLVLAPDLAPAALAVAERVAGERGAQIVRAPARHRTSPRRAVASPPPEGASSAELRARASGRARPTSTAWRSRWTSMPCATAAASTLCRDACRCVRRRPADRVRRRAQPATPSRALVESLPEVLGARATALVMGVLEDKDAARMLEPLLGACERAWFTAPPSRARALPRRASVAGAPARLRARSRASRAPSGRSRWLRSGPRQGRRPCSRRDRSYSWARLGLAGRRAGWASARARGSAAMNGEGPSVLTMMAAWRCSCARDPRVLRRWLWLWRFLTARCACGRCQAPAREMYVWAAKL